MAFAANVSKPKTISKTRAGSIRTVELKEPLPKAMNIGDGIAKKYDLMGRRTRPRAGGGAPKGKPLSGACPKAEETKEPSPCLVIDFF